MTTVDHQKQVINILKFYRSKLQSRNKDIDGQFDDTIGMLLEQMYTKAELTNVIDGLQKIIKAQVSDELAQFTQQQVMFLKHLYLQAEGLGQTLLCETKTLDDGALLAKMGEIDLDKKIIGSGEGHSPGDAVLIIKINDQKEQLGRIGQRMEKLNTQVDKTKNQNQSLEAESKQLQGDITAAQASMGASGTLQNEINTLREELRKIQEKNEAEVNAVRVELFPLKDQLSTKVVESTQYKQFQKMIETKNKTMRECQAQLEENKKK